MDPLLLHFNGDVHTKEAVKTFIKNHIDTEALKLMYNRKDVSHVADAVDLITKAFEELETQYGLTEQPHAPTNDSR